jgi:putative metallohydrolase (TIGR04338 family)
MTTRFAVLTEDMAVGDQDKYTVYAAENDVEMWLATRTGTVTVEEETFTPEAEAKFGDLESVQRYVDQVLTHLRERGVTFEDRADLDVTVAPRHGHKKAEYFRSTCTIKIPTLKSGGDWAMREAVLLHELAHHLSPQTGHGWAFRDTHLRLMEAIGKPVTAILLQRAYSIHGLDDIPTEDRLVNKIGKLLRQAEGASTDHERDAFLTRAQSLATQNQIALAVARAANRNGEKAEAPEFRYISTGVRGSRGLRQMVRLALVIARNNDVKCFISHRQDRVTILGYPSDLAVVEALYGSLAAQMVTAGVAYLATGDYRSETMWSDRQWREVPVSGITAKLAFYEGFIDVISTRLREAREAAIGTAMRADVDPNAATSTAVVLRNKELAVTDYYQAQVKAQNVRGSWGGAGSFRDKSMHGHLSGKLAGNTAHLGNEKRIG